MRLSLFILLFALASTARAEWTGVAFELGDIDLDWEFDDGVRTSKANTIRLYFEESTESGLAVGAALGYLDARLQGDENVGSFKFDAENLIVYLRQDIALGETNELYGLFSYGYYNGRESGSESSADVEWNEIALELGLRIRVNNLGVTPFASYIDVDGDITGSDINRSLAFELEDPVIYGVDINVYTDSTAYVGLRLQTGSKSGGYLSFVRRY